MARVDCNRGNFWCWSKKCKAAKKCACNVCGPLKTVNLNLYDACVDDCQEVPRPVDSDTFLCKNIGPEVLFNRYGVVLCGFDPKQTLEAELFEKSEATKAKNQRFETNIMVGIGTLVLILIIQLLW